METGAIGTFQEHCDNLHWRRKAAHWELFRVMGTFGSKLKFPAFVQTPLGVTRLELRKWAGNSASAEFPAHFRSSSRVTPRGSRLSRAKVENFLKILQLQFLKVFSPFSKFEPGHAEWCLHKCR